MNLGNFKLAQQQGNILAQSNVGRTSCLFIEFKLLAWLYLVAEKCMVTKDVVTKILPALKCISSYRSLATISYTRGRSSPQDRGPPTLINCVASSQPWRTRKRCLPSKICLPFRVTRTCLHLDVIPCFCSQWKSKSSPMDPKIRRQLHLFKVMRCRI